MEHFTIFTAVPKARADCKIQEAFLDTFAKLEPGTAFAFPIPIIDGVKDPLGPHKHARASLAPKGARYRWEHDGKGNAVVYRTK